MIATKETIFTKDAVNKEGGLWLYYMQGPDDARHYCRVDFKNIITNKSFVAVDSFCDENGNITTDMPSMHWTNVFSPSGTGTKVEVEMTFDSEAALEKIIDMGFKEGFAAAHRNLDELLAGQ